jgi:hypothetical protein
LPAEFVIGVQEEYGDDAVNRMLVFQRQMQLVDEHANRLCKFERRREDSAKTKPEDAVDAATRAAAEKASHDGVDAATVAAAEKATRAAAEKASDDAVDAATVAAAEKASHLQALVDLQQIANRMGNEYYKTIQEAITVSEKPGDSRTLCLKSGRPLDMFAASSWSESFIEFFFGDCAPNLNRPCKVAWRDLFDYLMSREELEYHLPTDRDDPDIPGGRYRAPAHSRWNTPEFACIFADTVRKINILQTTKAMFQRDGSKWKTDMELIAKAKVSDFEKLQSIIAGQRQHGIQDLSRLAEEHNLRPLYTALKQLTFQTANIPLTQGYKMGLRQLGFSLNIYDGPLTVFLTTNFADTYSPITVTLMNGAGEPLGSRDVNLLQSVPHMPTLQAMHRGLAKHPMIQAELFLLLDDLVHTELLCMKAFCGVKKYGIRGRKEPKVEDDFASTAQIGIAQLPRSGLKPLESQGRGFTHGHEKITSVPQTRAARLKELFTATASEHGQDELSRWCERARQAILQAAVTLQYDSAILSGTQLGVPLPPEPFTSRQQQLSKLDGKEEEDDERKLRRLIHVTGGPERNGHVKREEAYSLYKMENHHGG